MTDQSEHPGLLKVKEMWERGEFEKIDRMVQYWTALENLGLIGGMLQRFVIWVGIIAGGYLAFNGYVAAWIKAMARQ